MDVVSLQFLKYASNVDGNTIAYVHARDGKIVRGRMVHTTCEAELTVFFPPMGGPDAHIRKAIIIPHGIHTHPEGNPTKASWEAKNMFREWIQSQGGPFGATVMNVEHG